MNDQSTFSFGRRRVDGWKAGNGNTVGRCKADFAEIISSAWLARAFGPKYNNPAAASSHPSTMLQQYFPLPGNKILSDV